MRIAVTGHRDLDDPTAAEVAIALNDLLRSLMRTSAYDLVGISCLAAGADQIFARTVLALGGRLEVVLPSSGYPGTFTGPDREAFDELRRQACVTRTLAHGHPDPDSYLEAGLHMLESADLLVAVWDGSAARGRGGTAEIAEYARRRMPVRVVWPEGATRSITGRRTASLEVSMAESAATFHQLVADLRAIGVQEGRDLLVHASLRRLGPVEGGAVTVMNALREVVGPTGALVVPTFTQANSVTSTEHRNRTRDMTPAEYTAFLASMPAFDRDRTPSTGMGVLSETVRAHAAAIRSAHPQTSFAALGGDAAALMAGHAPDCHFGLRSPLFRLYEKSADVLLLGVGFDRCTAFHLAEYRYQRPALTRRYRCRVLEDAQPIWWEYEDVMLDDSDFGRIGAALEKNTDGVFRSPMAQATAFRFSLSGAVDFAEAWLAVNRPRSTGAPVEKFSLMDG